MVVVLRSKLPAMEAVCYSCCRAQPLKAFTQKLFWNKVQSQNSWRSIWWWTMKRSGYRVNSKLSGRHARNKGVDDLWANGRKLMIRIQRIFYSLTLENLFLFKAVKRWIQLQVFPTCPEPPISISLMTTRLPGAFEGWTTKNVDKRLTMTMWINKLWFESKMNIKVMRGS